NIDKVMALGWRPRTKLKEGIENSYQWALENNIFSPKVTRKLQTQAA
ncbi:MAG: hypothetical protein HQ462_02085, partial [Deltaproteobacteria bacterium]|nr:hypothetical protein [Deltaproteobacteria bacterium]